MSKKNTKALQELRREHNSRVARKQGIGYYVPTTVSKDEWLRLHKKWNKVLRDTGHDDIEQFSTDGTGHFSPYFVKTESNNSLSGSAATVTRLYNPWTQEYYRRLGIFFYHAPLKDIFGDKAELYAACIERLANGSTYQKLIDYLNSKECPRKLRKKRSIFWAWFHVKRIEAAMTEWFKSQPDIMSED